MCCSRITACLVLIFSASPSLASASDSQLRQMPLAGGPEAPGEVLTALERAQPVSMASGDFDEDGVPDLLVSYSAPGGNYLAIYRGNQDAIYPYSAGARQRRDSGLGHAAPFFETQQLISTEQSFEFLVAGDFNADGHLDLAGATRGDTRLQFLGGNGKGNLETRPAIELGGTLSTLAAGDVNRWDGLTDVVAAIQAEEEFALLVFENPAGALAGSPERIPLAEPATSIAIAELDGLPGIDIAVAVGSDLVLVHGRDRKLTQARVRREAVNAALIDQQSLGAGILGLAAGNWVPDSSGNSELSVFLDTGQIELLKAETRVTDPQERSDIHSGVEWNRTQWNVAGDHFAAGSQTSVSPVFMDQSVSWLVNRPENTASEVLSTGQIIATLPMRLNADALMDQVVITQGISRPTVDGTQGISTLTVNSAADNTTGGDSFCTLREAIIEANTGTGGDCGTGSVPGVDVIEFDIDGGGATATIALTDALPDVTDSVTINGNTQCGTPPCVKLDGSAVADPGDPSLYALTINTSNSGVRGLVFANWPYGGLKLQGLTGNHNVDGNYFGVDLDGLTPAPLAGSGLGIESPLNQIGGTVAAARNIFSRSRNGITIANTIVGESDASSNAISGNYVGTDSTGTVDLGNTLSGIYLTEASNNLIGGTSAGSGNLVSGNDSVGVFVRELTLPDFSTSGNRVRGNLIGTDASGTAGLGNVSHGVAVWDASNNTIGGTEPNAGNVISANGFDENPDTNPHGVMILQTEFYNVPTQNNEVLGNLIGTDSAGTADLGNATAGVAVISAALNEIGGAVAGAGNVISGNSWVGVYVYSGVPALPANTNSIQGNLIGTDITGTAALGNGSTGVYLHTGSTDTQVGGTDVASKNVMSANYYGIHVLDSDNNFIQGNFVGTNADGTSAIGNLHGGIVVSNGSNGNLIGGIGSGPPAPLGDGNTTQEGGAAGLIGLSFPGNLVSGNIDTGIAVYSDSPDNTIVGNYVGTDGSGFSALPNTGYGIATFSSGSQTIGGSEDGAGNLVSGNALVGIVLGAPSDGNIVQGNVVGLNAGRFIPVPNVQQGIRIGSSNNLVGGAEPGEGNIIAGNGFDGFVIADATAIGNRIEGNAIGTDENGESGLGNASNGIIMLLGASDNEIVGNRIQNNGNAGIVLLNDTGSGNTFSQNQISGNTGFGIDLDADGITANDNLDPDIGPNNRQNFPVLASSEVGSTIIDGSLNSLANTQFTIEFFVNYECDPGNQGEGETYLGSIQRTTNGSGNADLGTTLPLSAPEGTFITATATAPDGSTSEFSNCVVVGPGDTDKIFEDGFEAL